MSVRHAVRARGLSKAYRLGAARPAYDTVGQSIQRLLRGAWSDASGEEFWALRDVEFDVAEGEAVAIIGRNGAGKSTLLKILSRITGPTLGHVELRGRLASLLEVGTGFHHELTGRENIFLNGAILGLRRSEIVSRFDDIVSFAQVERFLDTPVKHYSSGMYMRLAFAVAAHLEPDILIIDEVLSVGDAEFQKRCLGRMAEIASSGRTILFVTHNMQAAATFCTSGILLEQGRVAVKGTIQEVIAAYTASTETGTLAWSGTAGGDEFTLSATSIRATNGQPVATTDQELVVRVEGVVHQRLMGLIAAVQLWSARQQLLVYSAYDDPQPPPAEGVEPGPFIWELTIPANTLAAGAYEIRFDLGLHHHKLLVEPGVGSLQFSLDNVAGVGRRFPSAWTHLIRPGWRWAGITRPDLHG